MTNEGVLLYLMMWSQVKRVKPQLEFLTQIKNMSPLNDCFVYASTVGIKNLK